MENTTRTLFIQLDSFAVPHFTGARSQDLNDVLYLPKAATQNLRKTW
jgi:hypothetical protein